MHILLTDVLACPRCGPEFGLILLADRAEDRRILEGRLGCANCRETYPVREGALDLRVGAAGGAESEAERGEAPPEAALLGLTGVSGTVLVAGPGAELAPGIAALVPDVETILYGARPAAGPEARGVSRVAGGGALPFQDARLRGVALTGGADEAALREGLRVLAPGARLVVDPAGEGVSAALRALGAEVLLDEEGVVVARAPGPVVPLRINAVR